MNYLIFVLVIEFIAFVQFTTGSSHFELDPFGDNLTLEIAGVLQTLVQKIVAYCLLTWDQIKPTEIVKFSHQNAFYSSFCIKLSRYLIYLFRFRFNINQNTTKRLFYLKNEIYLTKKLRKRNNYEVIKMLKQTPSGALYWWPNKTLKLIIKTIFNLCQRTND